MKFLSIMMLLLSPLLWADVPAGQQAEIEYLLEYVRNSDCAMERNGTRHKGDEAVAHIQRKYDYFRKDIESAEDFIEFSATKSTLSGKAYLVICSGQAPVRAKDWLLGALRVYREGQGR